MPRQRVVVLDDDPTGSQEATGVPVLLNRDRARLVDLLASNESLYILTNTRALAESEAVALLAGFREDIEFARAALDVEVLVVQRGDSTLRGHVFAEIDVFAKPESLVVFVPAFPAGGRETRDGVHRVLVDGRWRNAADTEFARDPVFGYSARSMVEYVRERGSRTGIVASPDDLLAATGRSAPGEVIAVDAATDDDLRAIADGIRSLLGAGRDVVVRCSAPLAAYLAGVKSTRLLDLADVDVDGAVLVVAGSHTGATTRQIEALQRVWPRTVQVSTDAALTDPVAAAHTAATALRSALIELPVALLATERVRRSEHGSLRDAAAVMDALSETVASVAELPGVVVAKGGITSAEIARRGLGAEVAWVIGQVATGVSLWRLGDPEAGLPYIVVPGNMGDADTLVEIVAKLTDSAALSPADARRKSQLPS